MLELSCNSFVEKLASKDPVPGGGSVSGFIGSISSALAEMACNLSVGKKSVLDKSDDINDCISKVVEYRNRFLELSERDAAVFEVLSKAYGLKADTDEEKRIKTEYLEKALVDACSVPFDTLSLTMELAAVIEKASSCTTKLMSSDVYCAAVICSATAECAFINVLANTRLMKNRAYAEEINAKSVNYLSMVKCKCDATVKLIGEKLN